jgi:GH25 family lysozyme M1 (1,4-beta-N-acetylmuramidase)
VYPSLFRTSLAAVTTAVLMISSPAVAADPTNDNGWAHAGTVPGGGAQRAESASRDAPGGYSIRGVDVSNHQKTVSWASMYRGGAKFAYAKASEGNYFTDAYWAGNYTNARRNHVYIGAYHYARPDQSSGKQQADYFLDRANYRSDGWTLPPMLDIEWPWSGSGSAYPCYGLTPSQLVTWIGQFVAQVKARTGQRTMIYTNTYWWNPCTANNTSFGDQPLFIANYSATSNPTLPAGWTRWTLWQYASSGSLPGDQDVFNGSMNTLASLARGGKGAQVAANSSVRAADGTPTVFSRGGDGHLHRTYWSPSTGVKDEDWGGSLAGTPVAFTDGGGALQVFGRGTDNRLRRWIWTRAAGVRIQDWGTDVGGDPAAFFRTTGEVDVFARGRNGHLQRWYYDPTSRRFLHEDWGGAPAGRVTAVFDPALDVEHVWGFGKDGQLKHWYLSNVTGGVTYQNWGGGAAGPPSAYITTGGEQQVFARDSHGALRRWYWSQRAGLRTETIGGDLAGPPSAVVDRTGFEHVWGCTRTGTLKHWYRPPAGGAWRVASWGGSCTAGPAAFVTTADYEHVYARGANSHLYHWVWRAGGGPFVEDWGGQLAM